MRVLLTEPGLPATGHQNGPALLTPPSVSAAPFLPARQPTAAPEPARQKPELRLGQHNTNSMGNSIRNAFICTETPLPQPSSLWLRSSLVLPVDSAPLILTSLPSLESCKEQRNNGSLFFRMFPRYVIH